MEDLFKKFINAGVGFVSLTTERVQNTIDTLVKESKLSEQEGAKIMDELKKNGETKRKELEKQFQGLTTRLMKTVGVAPNAEVEELKRTVKGKGTKTSAGTTASGSKAGPTSSAGKAAKGGAAGAASKTAGAAKKPATGAAATAGKAQKSAAGKAGATGSAGKSAAGKSADAGEGSSNGGSPQS